MDWTVILGTAAIVAATVAAGVLLDRYVIRLRPRPEDLHRDRRSEHAPGAAAATAITCSARRQRRIVARQRCDCGQRLARAGDDRARLGERDLVVVRLRCPGCGAVRSLYFTS